MDIPATMGVEDIGNWWFMLISQLEQIYPTQRTRLTDTQFVIKPVRELDRYYTFCMLKRDTEFLNTYI
jgi:hypothetical protein